MSGRLRASDIWWGIMEAADIEHFRRRLFQLKVELEGMTEASRDDTRPVELDQARVGRLSRMDAMQAQQMANEIARRREQQLVKTEGALRRIDTGDFGYCYVCGEEIDRRRLDVDPTATRCVTCNEG